MKRKDITPRFRRANATTWPTFSAIDRECKLLLKETESGLYSRRTLAEVWNIKPYRLSCWILLRDVVKRDS